MWYKSRKTVAMYDKDLKQKKKKKKKKKERI
ncbi:hypothetical protein QG37_03830 [Candidozyma auris]|uniref:Uncharacterized protein n=1 Tax=Candidozyma auris TaxID=498019 RepID=A0A0L0NZW2_CANAR|nr:hypothetical protein QG37_03830 [[Candida] auris]